MHYSGLSWSVPLNGPVYAIRAVSQMECPLIEWSCYAHKLGALFTWPCSSAFSTSKYVYGGCSVEDTSDKNTKSIMFLNAIKNRI